MFRSIHGSISKVRSAARISIVRAQSVREAATKSTGSNDTPKGVFSRTFSSLFGNKQAVINIFLSYFVLSLAIHNYRVKLQFEETLTLKDSAEKELNAMKERLNEETWLQKTVDQVQRARSPNEKVMVLKASLMNQADGATEELKPREASSSTGSLIPKLI